MYSIWFKFWASIVQPHLFLYLVVISGSTSAVISICHLKCSLKFRFYSVRLCWQVRPATTATDEDIRQTRSDTSGEKVSSKELDWSISSWVPKDIFQAPSAIARLRRLSDGHTASDAAVQAAHRPAIRCSTLGLALDSDPFWSAALYWSTSDGVSEGIRVLCQWHTAVCVMVPDGCSFSWCSFLELNEDLSSSVEVAALRAWCSQSVSVDESAQVPSVDIIPDVISPPVTKRGQ